MRVLAGQTVGFRPLNELRHAEIQNLRMALLSDEDILRLDVAMDDALLVGSLETFGDFNRKCEEFVDGKRATAFPGFNTLTQRLPAQKLHDNESLAFVFIHLVNRADAGMIERRSSPGLLLEAQKCGRIGRQVRQQELDRYPAAQRELTARVRAVLRRTQTNNTAEIHVLRPGDLEVDLDRRFQGRRKAPGTARAEDKSYRLYPLERVRFRSQCAAHLGPNLGKINVTAINLLAQ